MASVGSGTRSTDTDQCPKATPCGSFVCMERLSRRHANVSLRAPERLCARALPSLLLLVVQSGSEPPRASGYVLAVTAQRGTSEEDVPLEDAVERAELEETP